MTSTELTITQKTQAAIDQIRSPQISQEIAAALPEGVSPKQFLRVAATALMDNPELADADRTSLVKALFKCAQDGLVPDGRDAALVIFKDNKDGGKKKVQFMGMVGGLRRIAAEHGISIHASVVHANDEFEPDPDPLAHKIHHKGTRLGEDPGEIIGAYAIAQHKDGRKFGPIVMNMDEIARARKASRAPNSPAWTQWFDRMAEKTVVRKLWKELPFDSKDRERIVRLGDEAEANGDDPAEVLYGKQDDTMDVQPPAHVEPDSDETIEDADWSEAAGDGDGEVAFEGEEPPVGGEPAAEPATFTSGRHAGKTVQQVLDLGDEGTSYIKWAIKNWKTGDIVNDLAAFAAEHPELTS